MTLPDLVATWCGLNSLKRVGMVLPWLESLVVRSEYPSCCGTEMPDIRSLLTRLMKDCRATSFWALFPSAGTYNNRLWTWAQR
jgi:hypothetical protein